MTTWSTRIPSSVPLDGSAAGAPDEAPPGRPRRPGARRAAATATLVVLALALVILDLAAGERWLAPSEVVAVLLGDGSAGAEFLVRELRGPRVVGGIVAGACLGLSGGITQSLLRNPLASPDIVGVTAGASCLAVLSLLAPTAGAGLAWAVLPWSTAAAATLGGLLAGAVVVALAWRGGVGPRRVVLVGLGVNAGLGALTSWLLLRAELPDLTTAVVWLTGSLNGVDVDLLSTAVIGTAVCVGFAAATSRQLGLLRFGAYTVRALGVDLPRAQLLQALIAVVAAALACAVAGPVAFVAFAAPQVALLVLGTEGPPPLGGALVGVVVVLGADLIARTAFPEPIPVGLVTAVAGAPLMLWVLLRPARG